MALRINTNIAAARSSRYLAETDRQLAQSLERLSTGFKINRAKDNPSGLVFSEQMRGQIIGVTQAIANSELANTIVQTSEGALTEVNNLLIRMRQVALQASNTASSEPLAREIGQAELDDAMSTISLIARDTKFGKQTLLDGSNGVTGEAQGEGLSFVNATLKTRSSPVEGYEVDITQVPTRSSLQGETALDAETLPGLEVSLMEGGRSVRVQARAGDTPEAFFGRLRGAAARAGLALQVSLTENNALLVTHREFGSEHTFQGASNLDGALTNKTGLEGFLDFFSTASPAADVPVLVAANPGQDVAGLINGEPVLGRGQLLRGVPGSANTEGLVVRYQGPLLLTGLDPEEGTPLLEPNPREGVVGVVSVMNNAMGFQVGASSDARLGVALPRVAPQYLARSVTNASQFGSLADINVKTPQASRDSLRVIDSAIDELTLRRGELGALSRNSLETNIANLRVTAENLMAAESTVRDADMAMELANLTRSRILMDSGTAAAAHSSQITRSVIRLLQ